MKDKKIDHDTRLVLVLGDEKKNENKQQKRLNEIVNVTNEIAS